MCHESVAMDEKTQHFRPSCYKIMNNNSIDSGSVKFSWLSFLMHECFKITITYTLRIVKIYLFYLQKKLPEY